MSTLNDKLRAALKSREERHILRRLPDPTPGPSPTSSSPLTDFTSNDYLSLSSSPHLRRLFLAKLSSAPHVLGTTASRLLSNPAPHAQLEARLARYLRADAALLFTSGYDANVGFFSAVPQAGDVVVYDEYIHASVHDGMRASRCADRAPNPNTYAYTDTTTSTPASLLPFAHNSLPALLTVLKTLLRHRPALADGTSSVFIAVESLYSMDGTLAPLLAIVEAAETLFPRGNAHVVVDEAHATGVYGRGRVVEMGLEGRVLARLCTFGKALAGSGAVILTTELIRDYLVNYARSLIYTTSLTHANVIAIDCSFDLLEDGTAEVLAAKLFDLSTYLLDLLRPHLATIPPRLLSLP
ncbi:PLP-dependent transferase, partial [Leucogyrophana mollusca]